MNKTFQTAIEIKIYRVAGKVRPIFNRSNFRNVINQFALCSYNKAVKSVSFNFRGGQLAIQRVRRISSVQCAV